MAHLRFTYIPNKEHVKTKSHYMKSTSNLCI